METKAQYGGGRDSTPRTPDHPRRRVRTHQFLCFNQIARRVQVMRGRVVVQGLPRLRHQLLGHLVQGDVHRVRQHHSRGQAGQVDEREVGRAASLCHFARRRAQLRIDRATALE